MRVCIGIMNILYDVESTRVEIEWQKPKQNHKNANVSEAMMMWSAMAHKLATSRAYKLYRRFISYISVYYWIPYVCVSFQNRSDVIILSVKEMRMKIKEKFGAQHIMLVWCAYWKRRNTLLPCRMSTNIKQIWWSHVRKPNLCKHQ